MNFGSTLNSEEIYEIAERYRAFDFGKNGHGRKDDFDSNESYQDSVKNLRTNEIRGTYLSAILVKYLFLVLSSSQ